RVNGDRQGVRPPPSHPSAWPKGCSNFGSLIPLLVRSVTSQTSSTATAPQPPPLGPRPRVRGQSRAAPLSDWPTPVVRGRPRRSGWRPDRVRRTTRGDREAATGKQAPFEVASPPGGGAAPVTRRTEQHVRSVAAYHCAAPSERVYGGFFGRKVIREYRDTRVP